MFNLEVLLRWASKKKTRLVGMSTLLILLSFGPGYHIIHPGQNITWRADPARRHPMATRSGDVAHGSFNEVASNDRGSWSRRGGGHAARLSTPPARPPPPDAGEHFLCLPWLCSRLPLHYLCLSLRILRSWTRCSRDIHISHDGSVFSVTTYIRRCLLWGVIRDIALTIVITFMLQLTLFTLKLEDFMIMNTTLQRNPYASHWLVIYSNHQDLFMFVAWGSYVTSWWPLWPCLCYI
jgi:hypothetical protein